MGVVLLALAGVARAAEQTAPAVPGSALESAKREFEALNFSDPSVNFSGSRKLQRGLPPLETTPDDRPILSPIQRARKTANDAAVQQAVPSKTWLLDSLRDNMNAPTGGLDGLSSADEIEKPTVSSPDSELSSSHNNPHRHTRATREGEPRRTRHELGETAVRNPLDAYMSKWMTARDFELLRSRSGAVEGRTASAILPAISTATAVPSASLLFSEINTTAPFVELGDLRLTVIHENPYLEAFTPPTLQNAPSQISVAPVQSSSKLTLLPETRAPLMNEVANPEPQPSFAEQLKAQDEARFFKQLKRF